MQIRSEGRCRSTVRERKKTPTHNTRDAIGYNTHTHPRIAENSIRRTAADGVQSVNNQSFVPTTVVALLLQQLKRDIQALAQVIRDRAMHAGIFLGLAHHRRLLELSEQLLQLLQVTENNLHLEPSHIFVGERGRCRMSAGAAGFVRPART